jgi:hypothetical protein
MAPDCGTHEAPGKMGLSRIQSISGRVARHRKCGFLSRDALFHPGAGEFTHRLRRRVELEVISHCIALVARSRRTRNCVFPVHLAVIFRKSQRRARQSGLLLNGANRATIRRSARKMVAVPRGLVEVSPMRPLRGTWLTGYNSPTENRLADKNAKASFARSRKLLILNWSHPPGSNRRPADYELQSETPWFPLASIFSSLRMPTVSICTYSLPVSIAVAPSIPSPWPQVLRFRSRPIFCFQRAARFVCAFSNPWRPEQRPEPAAPGPDAAIVCPTRFVFRFFNCQRSGGKGICGEAQTTTLPRGYNAARTELNGIQVSCCIVREKSCERGATRDVGSLEVRNWGIRTMDRLPGVLIVPGSSRNSL